MLIQKSRRGLGSVALAAALAVAAGACSDGTGPGGSGRVSLVLRGSSAALGPSVTRLANESRTMQPAMTVSPATCGGFEAAGVTISQIYLQGQGGETVLRSTPAVVDLCDLANETLTLVSDVAVPSGTYNQLRLVITGGFVQDASDGKVYATPGYELPTGIPAATGALQLPSWGSSGLKIDSEGGNVTIGSEQKVWALDFDVAQSFGRAAGGSGDWVMSPIIKTADISFTGSVKVTLTTAQGVSLPSPGGTQLTYADFSVTAENGSVSVTQSFDATTGETTLFLPPQSTPYTLTLNVPATVDVTVDPFPPPPVTIVEGEQSPEVVFTLQSVTLKP
jgi:hypothetical protein